VKSQKGELETLWGFRSSADPVAPAGPEGEPNRPVVWWRETEWGRQILSDEEFIKPNEMRDAKQAYEYTREATLGQCELERT